MDDRRFDQLAKAVATVSRRRLLQAVIGGLAAPLVGSRPQGAARAAAPPVITSPTPNLPFLVALPTDPGLDHFPLDFTLTGPPTRYHVVEAVPFLSPRQQDILRPALRVAYAATIASAQSGNPKDAQRSITTFLADLGTADAATRAYPAYVATLLVGPNTKRLPNPSPVGDVTNIIGCNGGCESAWGSLPGTTAPYLGLAVVSRRDRFLIDARLRDFANQPVTAADGTAVATLVDAKLVEAVSPSADGPSVAARLAVTVKPMAAVAPLAPLPLPSRAQSADADVRRSLERADPFPIFGTAGHEPPKVVSRWLAVHNGALVAYVGETAAEAARRRQGLGDARYAEYAEQPLPLAQPYRGDYALHLSATRHAFRTADAARAFIANTQQRLVSSRPTITLTEVTQSATERSYIYQDVNPAGRTISGYQTHVLASAGSVDAALAVSIAAVPREPNLPPLPDDVLRRELGPMVAQAIKVLTGCLSSPAACSSAGTLPPPGPTCPSGTQLCGGGCVDPASDPANCGGCGTSCGGAACCGGTCIDLTTDRANCGGCGVACPRGAACVGGTCGAAGCPPGTRRCAGDCVDLGTDVANCGRCGNACASGQSCVDGRCVCPRGLTACGDVCVDLASDPKNCGRCDSVCPAGTCRKGACGCAQGLTDCGGQCVDLAADPANCGKCGNGCAAGESCTAGICVPPCPTGRSLCGTACVDLATDPKNCGQCDVTCKPGESCTRGRCMTVVTQAG